MIRFLKLKDPANFGLIYAIKALIGVGIASLVAFLIGGKSLMLWAINGSVCLFFVTTFKGSKRDRNLGLLLYITLCIAFILSINFIANLGIWLFLPAFVFIFIGSFLSLYHPNFSTSTINATFVCFVVLVVGLNLPGFNPKIAAFGFFIGAFIAMLVRGMTSYGNYTKKTFNVLFDDLILLLNGKVQANIIINEILKTKDVLNAKSAELKDSNLIQNHSRMVFYLYKVEELTHTLNSISLNSLEKNEISSNINELKKLLLNKEPNFSFINQNQNNHIVYEILQEIIDGGKNPQTLLPQRVGFNFSVLKNTISFKNQTFVFSLKFALAVSISLLFANIFNIQRGI